MASRPKRARPSEGFYRNVDEGTKLKYTRISKKSAPRLDQNFYEIEVVDRDKEKGKIKIHYVGYDSEYDEWRDCDELLRNGIGNIQRRVCAGEESLNDRSSLFFDRLSRKIKHSLIAAKKESPEVRVEELCDLDVYNFYLKDVGKTKNSMGRQVHCVESVKDLSLVRLLGERWYERILNKNGDFCYVMRGTIQFWLHQKKAIKEYILVGKQLLEKMLENDLILVFTFVRGDGVGSEYTHDTWK